MRRRYRRNPLPGMQVAPASAAEGLPSLKGLTVFGVVCNPKNHEPLLVVTDGDYVSLRALKRAALGKRMGRGYYEGDENRPAELTGYPRCHTPDGVIQKGGGYGTALYASLALGAQLVNNDYLTIDMWKRETGDGVCSWTDNRSTEADRWWSAAVDRGIAKTHAYEDEEKEENVELDVSPRDLDDLVDDNQTVVYVNEVNVDIETTKEENVETLTYEAISDEVHLVAASFAIEVPGDLLDNQEALGLVWRSIQEGSGEVTLADPMALMSIDVRGLDRSALSLISVLYEQAELGDAARDELEERFRSGIDPSVAFKQRHLFTPNQAGMGDVEWARKEANWELVAELP